MKKGQVQDAFVNAIFYIALLLVLVLIAYGLLSGKAPALFQTIIDKLRFF